MLMAKREKTPFDASLSPVLKILFGLDFCNKEKGSKFYNTRTFKNAL